MGNFFTLKYWFTANPGSLDPTAQYGLFILLAGFLAAGIIFFLVKKAQKRGLFFKFWVKLQNFFITNFLLGLFLLFFSYERVPILSSRLLYLIWLVSMITWMVFIILYSKKIPIIKKKLDKQKEFNKYIP